MADALPPLPPLPPALELRLRADRASVRVDRLRLSGHVVLSTRRWRLGADRVEVTRDGPDAYRVTGPLSLTPCPCADAPLRLDVREARLALDRGEFAVVSLRGATVRLGGLPVLYAPWWQFRSERSWGLLPPRVAVRAHDGLLAGVGLHAPLGPGAWVQLEPAFYLRGGLELLGRALVPGGSLALRWDHRPAGDLLALRGQGMVAPREGTVAWDIDAQRGPLDRVIGLDDAARARDRARVAWVLPWAGSFATAVRAVAPRGDGSILAGPQTTWAGSVADGSLGWALEASSLSHPGQGLGSVLRAEVDATRSWWWGPWRLRPALASLGAVVSRPSGASLEGAALASLRVELPLVRDGDVRNRLEPGAWLAAVGARSSSTDDWVLPPALPSHTLLGAGRMRSAWMWPSGALVSLRAAAGAVVSGDGWAPAARLVLAADRGSLHGVVDAAASGSRDGTLAAIVSAGQPMSWHLDLRVDGQLGHPGPHARLLDGASPWAGPWYDATGWSGLAAAAVPLGRSWRAVGRVAASVDTSGADWLGHSLGMLYTSPCGCLSAGLTGAQRRGREGVDVMASLGLGAGAALPSAMPGGW